MKKLKINQKFLLKGNYSRDDVFQNLVRPLLQEYKTLKIGVPRIVSEIIKETLEQRDMTLNELGEIKNQILNPNINFAVQITSKNPEVAYLFSSLVNASPEQSIKDKNNEILELIKSKKEILDLINE